MADSCRRDWLRLHTNRVSAARPACRERRGRMRSTAGSSSRMAAWFILIVLTGFIPDSLDEGRGGEGRAAAAVPAGAARPRGADGFVPAAAAGAERADGDRTVRAAQAGRHRRLRAGAGAGHGRDHPGADHLPSGVGCRASGPPRCRRRCAGAPLLENILLLQIHVGILFALFMAMALRARAAQQRVSQEDDLPGDRGAVAGRRSTAWVAADARFRRARWRPTGTSCWRCRRCSCGTWSGTAGARGLLVWAAIYLPASLVMYRLWDTPGWHATAQAIMGV